MDEKEIKFIDLFGGIGGFRLGLENRLCNKIKQKRSKGDNRKRNSTKFTSKRSNGHSQFNCVWYCDIDKYATQTYNKNFQEEYKPTDITTVNIKDIPDFDMLCAGFPCQSFSIAGKRAGFKDT